MHGQFANSVNYFSSMNSSRRCYKIENYYYYYFITLLLITLFDGKEFIFEYKINKSLILTKINSMNNITVEHFSKLGLFSPKVGLLDL